jgi:hypothetical protein
MSKSYYGVIIPMPLYVTRMALNSFEIEVDNLDYGAANNMMEEGEKERLEYIKDYKQWSRKQLLREYIKYIGTMSSWRKLIKEEIVYIDRLDEIQLENILTIRLWKFIEFNEIDTYKISNGDYIFAGYLINNGNNLLPISKSIPKEWLDEFRHELDLWGFNDFEIDFYSGPALGLYTEVDEENKDKL